MPAASAVTTLTITSPAAAADASRAVMLTASPSAVKSSTVVPSPVAPTNASPVWMAVPTGMATLDVLLARARSVKSIAAATAAAACRGPVTPPQYVALGDSYAAGQGGGDYVDKECLESAKGYPYLLDPKMRIDLRVNAACTGASTSNVSDMISLGQLSELNEDTELVT